MSSTKKGTGKILLIAIPVVADRLCMHFGHCEEFAILDVDTASKEILNSRRFAPPAHEPGVLPRWLQQEGVNLVISGGMGGRARQIFAEQGIEVIVGAPAEPPETVVRNYLDGSLQSGENICDH